MDSPPERVGTVLVGSRGSEPVDGADGASGRVSLHYVLDPWVLAASGADHGGGAAAPEGDVVGLEPRPRAGEVDGVEASPEAVRVRRGGWRRALERGVA